MTSTPFEALDLAARHAEIESRRLSQMMIECLHKNTPQGNRRRQTPDGFWVEQRQGERRSPERATAGRRSLSDRRVPAEERVREWQAELAQHLERSIEISARRRRLEFLLCDPDSQP